MNGVSTGHFVRGMATAKEVFLANGAVGHVLSGFAIVIVEQYGINAHTAIMAMGKILTASDAAKPAVIAVVGILLTGHPKVANAAMVFTKVDTACYAVVSVE